MPVDARTIASPLLETPSRSSCEALIARATLAASLLPPAPDGVAFRIFWDSEDLAASRGGPTSHAADRAGVASPVSHTVAFAELVRGEHLVVGRHSRCDVRLSHPAVALRHVLLRAIAGPIGDELAVHDLLSEQPFALGLRRERLLAAAVTGPTVIGIASHAIVALPTRGARRAEADESALRPRVVDADPALARVIPARLDELAVRTQIDLVSRSTVRPQLAPLPVEMLACPARATVRLALRGPAGRVVVSLSDEDLARPVLVGRYPRCRRGELAPFSGKVSRVHAAVVRDGDALCILDLASTNGLSTRARGGRIEKARAIRVASRASIALGTASDRLDVEVLE